MSKIATSPADQTMRGQAREALQGPAPGQVPGLVRVALNGPTMGTRWSAIVGLPEGTDSLPLARALQTAVEEVDAQMSLWRPESALVALNRAPVGEWLTIPAHLAQVLMLGLAIGRASGGAFDVAMGDAVAAWGFGPGEPDPCAIRAARATARIPAWEAVELQGCRVRKRAPVQLDLNGIAKGYGVDRLAIAVRGLGVGSALVGIDGEMRALGARPDGQPWAVAIEAPEPERRAVRSVLTLEDRAVATSGDYRHFVTEGGRRLSHTMDPAKGAPVEDAPASVTVLAASCAVADAWATALLVCGWQKGAALAARHGLDALWLSADAGEAPVRVGPSFAAGDRRPQGQAARAD